MERTKMKRLLTISQAILGFNAFMDILVFYLFNYHVPSTVVSAMSIGCIGLIQAIKILVKQ